jgi:hypothetical protein
VNPAHGPHPPLGGCTGCRRHLLGLLDRVRQRLLAEHLLAGLQRGNGNLSNWSAVMATAMLASIPAIILLVIAVSGPR